MNESSLYKLAADIADCADDGKLRKLLDILYESYPDVYKYIEKDITYATAG